jgi:hypothetical protein
VAPDKNLIGIGGKARRVPNGSGDRTDWSTIGKRSPPVSITLFKSTAMKLALALSPHTAKSAERPRAKRRRE